MLLDMTLEQNHVYDGHLDKNSMFMTGTWTKTPCLLWTLGQKHHVYDRYLDKNQCLFVILTEHWDKNPYYLHHSNSPYQ